MRGRGVLVFFGVTAFAGMLTMLISKEKVAELAMKVRREGGREGGREGLVVLSLCWF
jgi:hypothetical protein